MHNDCCRYFMDRVSRVSSNSSLNFPSVLLVLHSRRIGLAHSAPLILRCTDFNITSLHEISFQCDKASTCMFANVKADSETEFAFSSELYMSTYKCLGFVHSSLERLPIDLFKHYPNIEILYAPKLGLLSVTRTLFEPASRLQDVHLQGNKLTGELFLIEKLETPLTTKTSPQNWKTFCSTARSIFVGLYFRATKSPPSAKTLSRK